jgi:hypothetical protein
VECFAILLENQADSELGERCLCAAHDSAPTRAHTRRSPNAPVATWKDQ